MKMVPKTTHSHSDDDDAMPLRVDSLKRSASLAPLPKRRSMGTTVDEMPKQNAGCRRSNQPEALVTPASWRHSLILEGRSI